MNRFIILVKVRYREHTEWEPKDLSFRPSPSSGYLAMTSLCLGEFMGEARGLEWMTPQLPSSKENLTLICGSSLDSSEDCPWITTSAVRNAQRHFFTTWRALYLEENLENYITLSPITTSRLHLNYPNKLFHDTLKVSLLETSQLFLCLSCQQFLPICLAESLCKIFKLFAFILFLTEGTEVGLTIHVLSIINLSHGKIVCTIEFLWSYVAFQ